MRYISTKNVQHTTKASLDQDNERFTLIVHNKTVSQRRSIAQRMKCAIAGFVYDAILNYSLTIIPQELHHKLQNVTSH